MRATKDLASQNAQTKSSAFEMCAEALRWEEIGEYEEAVRCLTPVWAGVGASPNVEGLDPAEAAETLLRCGKLTAWLGDSQLLVGVQSLARDLLNDATALSRSLGDGQGVAEAGIGIAITYWREREYGQARNVLHAAFKEQTGGDTYLRLTIASAMVEIWDGHLDVALKLYASIERFIKNSENYGLRARYHHNYGLTLKRFGLLEKAFEQYNESLRCLDALGNLRLRGNVLNNLGTLCSESNNLAAAHDYLNQAREVFEFCGDKSSVGQVDDSIAQAYLAGHDFAGAEVAARRAVAAHEQGDGAAFLVEALETLGKALARQRKVDEAVIVFRRAAELAATSIGEGRSSKIALLMIEELSTPAYLEAGLTFDEAVHRFEEQLLKTALQKSNKNLKEAAMMLGLKYDTLRWVLNHRHKSLITERSEVKTRKRSIIGRRSAKKTQRRASVSNIADKRKSK